jgi:hypothetical protein
VLSFTTSPSPPAPTVTTQAASALTSSSATLNGSANPNGAATSGWFRYATTDPGSCSDSFGTRAPASGGSSLGSGGSAVAYSQPISGLSPGTTYYFCAIAQNTAGTSFGAVLSFTTSPSPPAPTVTTQAASALTSSSATLNGTVNPNGQATSYHFDWGTSQSYLSSTSTQSAGSGTGNVAASANLTGLSPGTTYHYRLVATNGSGTTNGSDGSFTTSPAPSLLPPSLVTLGSTSPTLKISSAPVRLTKRGVARLGLTCSATGPSGRCAGRLEVKTNGKVSVGGRRRQLTLGSASFSIPSGETATVPVNLPTSRRKLVQGMGRVMAMATATAQDSPVVTQIFRLNAH